MSGLEPLIATGLALLGTTAFGISIKQAVPSLVKVGTFGWKLYTERNLKNKLINMLITYTQSKYPHGKEKKDMKKRLEKLFKKVDNVEIFQLKKFYKEIRELFYAVSFNDNYYQKRQDKLLLDGEAMRNYLVKKLYIQRIFDIILIKLYNNPLNEEDKKLMFNDLVDTFMNENITYEKLELLVSNMEQQLKIQYKQQKKRYDTDFRDEQSFLMKIMKASTKGLDRNTRTAVLSTIEIIEEAKNVECDSDINVESGSLKRMKSLSKTITPQIEETKQKSLLVKSRPALPL